MRPEYDFRGGVRGKYVAPDRTGVRTVRLDPDLARAFPDARSVQRALRLIAEVARRSAGR